MERDCTAEPLATVVQESRSGSVLPPEDPERLAQAILEYRNSPNRVRAEAAREGTW
jgi:hypothetical protein